MGLGLETDAKADVDRGAIDWCLASEWVLSKTLPSPSTNYATMPFRPITPDSHAPEPHGSSAPKAVPWPRPSEMHTDTHMGPVRYSGILGG